SLGSLAIFLFLDRVLLPRIERGRLRPGSALAASAGFYAVLRFFVDFLRGTGPGRYSLPGLTLAQTLALPAMLLSAAWLRLRDE
ncbi:MAG: hypothetical protein KGK30_05955, partial [Elusimicrobia bacterium]|nr:hypothetical protein [Elusimicrobiota bacterium]